MASVFKDEDEARRQRIDDATDDWYRSQRFPTVPVISGASGYCSQNAFATPAVAPLVLDLRRPFFAVPEQPATGVYIGV